MTRKAYNSENILASGPYSHAVDSGELVFLSGQTPKNSASGRMERTCIKEQTKECFNNLFDVLKAANLTPDDVIKVNVYLTDMNNFKDMNEVYEEQFSKPYPARTTIAVLALPLGAEVEIEMIAKRP